MGTGNLLGKQCLVSYHIPVPYLLKPSVYCTLEGCRLGTLPSPTRRLRPRKSRPPPAHHLCLPLNRSFHVSFLYGIKVGTVPVDNKRLVLRIRIRVRSGFSRMHWPRYRSRIGIQEGKNGPEEKSYLEGWGLFLEPLFWDLLCTEITYQGSCFGIQTVSREKIYGSGSEFSWKPGFGVWIRIRWIWISNTVSVFLLSENEFLTIVLVSFFHLFVPISNF